jgi:hypothetical protein
VRVLTFEKVSPYLAIIGDILAILRVYLLEGKDITILRTCTYYANQREGQTRVFTAHKESLYEAYFDTCLQPATDDRRTEECAAQFCFQYVPQFYEVEAEGMYIRDDIHIKTSPHFYGFV